MPDYGVDGLDSDTLRALIFSATLAVLVAAEYVAPHRPQQRRQRWRVNSLMLLAGNLLARLVLPLTAVGAAALAAENQWGMLTLTSFPDYLVIMASVAVLDITIYWQHRLFHQLPVLWRLHRVHHGDREVDVTTGIRFHPAEIVLSMVVKIAVIIALGVPVVAVMIFEVLLSSCALFNHSNIRLPDSIESLLRKILITPSLHRVHHSCVRVETNSNYGFSVPWWDRLFGSYCGTPGAGEEGLVLGLGADERRLPVTLFGLLCDPFSRRQE